jgi:hypothetical protein
MQINKSIIIIILSALVAALAVFSFIMFNKMSNMETYLRQAEQYSHRDKDGRNFDPYITQQVKNTISKNTFHLLECYKGFVSACREKNRKSRDSKFVCEGRVKADWNIDPGGRVLNPEIVSSDIQDTDFQQCFISSIQKWSFPEPPFGTRKYVEHTFNFVDQEKGK